MQRTMHILLLLGKRIFLIALHRVNILELSTGNKFYLWASGYHFLDATQ